MFSCLSTGIWLFQHAEHLIEQDSRAQSRVYFSRYVTHDGNNVAVGEHNRRQRSDAAIYCTRTTEYHIFRRRTGWTYQTKRRRDDFKFYSRNRRNHSDDNGIKSAGSQGKEWNLRFRIYAATRPNSRHGPRRLGAAQTQPVVSQWIVTERDCPLWNQNCCSHPVQQLRTLSSMFAMRQLKIVFARL